MALAKSTSAHMTISPSDIGLANIVEANLPASDVIEADLPAVVEPSSSVGFRPFGDFARSQLTQGLSAPTLTLASGRTDVARAIDQQINDGRAVPYNSYADSTSFRQWAESGAKGEIPKGSQACWEPFLAEALRQNLISPQRVAQAYAGGLPRIEALLTTKGVTRYDPGNGLTPKLGELVYFEITQPDGSPLLDQDGNANPAPLLAHAGIVVGFAADGSPLIASHFPAGAESSGGKTISAPLERTSIGAIEQRLSSIGTVNVYYGSPPW